MESIHSSLIQFNFMRRNPIEFGTNALIAVDFYKKYLNLHRFLWLHKVIIIGLNS